MEVIMPRRDGTGNPGMGRGAGLGQGAGLGLGRGQGAAGRPLGSEICTCSKCGYQEPHNRGIPCVKRKCPKCDAKMVGEFCK